MDAVPGMPTQFVFKPIKTTVEMREQLSHNPVWQAIDPELEEPRYVNFNYEVACAELCGKGHSSMKYTLVVETEEEYNEWLKKQSSYFHGVKDNLRTSKEPELEETRTAVLIK
jgi:cytochrome c oxidase subunit 2